MVQYYTHLFIDHTCKLRIFKYIIKKKKLIDRERKRGPGVRRQDRLAQNWVSNTKSQHIGEWARIQSPNSSSPHLFSALGYIYIYIYFETNRAGEKESRRRYMKHNSYNNKVSFNGPIILSLCLCLFWCDCVCLALLE